MPAEASRVTSNLPFWDNKAALRVSGVQSIIPGYIDNPQLGEADVNGGASYSLRASLLVKPTDDFTARVSAFEQHLFVHGSNSQQVVGAAASTL